MELTFVNDLGQSFIIEIDPNMELENIMALLEAEVSSEFHGTVWPLLILSGTVWHTCRRTKHLIPRERP